MKIKKFLSLLTVAAMMLTTCSVTALAADGDVAQIGKTTYATLYDAVNAAKSGDTIKLIGNTENTKQLLIGKNITLDLNGNKLKSSNEEAKNIFIEGGKLTLTDSVGGGEIYSDTKYTAVASHGVIAIQNGEMIMNGGTISAAFDNPYNNGNFAVIVQDNSTFTLNNGKINAGYYCVSGNGTCKNTVINVNGGEMYSTMDFAIYAPAKGNSSVNVTGGTVAGAGGGIAERSGKLSVIGGEILCDGTGNTGNYDDGTGKMDISAISVVSNYGDVDANISGGKIMAKGNAKVLNVVAPKNTADMTVTGGTFSTDVSAYVPAGADIKTKADGSTVINPVAEINGDYFSTLQYAFNDASDNDTVTLIADTDITGVGAEFNSKTITLDLNGHSIKTIHNPDSTINVTYGSLTLKDTQGTGEIYSVPNGRNWPVINLYNSNFEMLGGTIDVSQTNDPVNMGSTAIGAWVNSNVTITDGKITAGWYCVATNGSLEGVNDGRNATITINGGTLISTKDFAVYAPAYNGTVTVNGGTVYGAAGAVAMKRGSLKITGGEVTSKGNGDTGIHNDGTSGMKEAAISLQASYGDISTEITGGKVTAPAGKDAIAIVNKKEDKGTVLPPVITGGEYSSDPIEFIDSVSYASVKGETLYTVEERKEIVSDIAVMTESSKTVDNEKIYPITIFAGLKYLDYKNAGFEITADDEQKDDITTTTAYNKISVNGTDYDKTSFGGSSYVFGAILNLKDSDKNIKSLKIRPFATTQNGTKIYGEARTVNIGE